MSRERALQPHGWNERIAADFAPWGEQGFVAGRVVLERRELFGVATAEGEIEATVAGALRHRAAGPHELPAVGDWVALSAADGDSPARIQGVLPRTSRFSRKVAGSKTQEQVVAANLDRLFIVMGLDGDYSLRRLERYLVAAWESGAQPIIVLNKADLHADADAAREEVETVAAGVPILVTSCVEESGLELLEEYLVPGETIALVGSSGVGKSTLVNLLYGEEILRTGEVRTSDERGQHTTSHRQLLRLQSGALLIDNPGIRELQLWADSEGLDAIFNDVEELSEQCQFRDCSHSGEPGCAVRHAVERGALDEERLASYEKMRSELAYLERRQDESAARLEKRKWRAIHRSSRKHKPRSM